MGRIFTLGLGVIIIGLSLWIAVSQQQSLFSLMVTIFALFLAPTMLPMLAGLTVRTVTWRGALSGFLAGLTVGLINLVLKTWYLTSLPGMQGEGASFRFEAFSIVSTIIATAAGLWLGSVLPKKDSAEQDRIREFFRKLDTPVTASEVKSEDAESPVRHWAPPRWWSGSSFACRLCSRPRLRRAGSTLHSAECLACSVCASFEVSPRPSGAAW